jgi:predicted nucleic acid-binding Zn ribbon protein
MVESKKNRAEPEALGGLVQATLARLGIGTRVARAQVIADWPELVGPHIADVARPVRIRGSTLFVAVESAAWRNELSLMRPQLMRKINAGRSEGRIERILFLQDDGGNAEARDGAGER